MKTNNKVEIDAEYTDDMVNLKYKRNFTPQSDKKFSTLIRNAGTMMMWNKVQRLIIYMPDEFVNKNLTKENIVIIEE
jgi:hypothetical protein